MLVPQSFPPPSPCFVLRGSQTSCSPSPHSHSPPSARMLPWPPYPTHPHDQQHYGSATPPEPYGFPAVPRGESAHTPSSASSEYGIPSYASLDTVHQEAPCPSQILPVEATSQSSAGRDAMASERGADAPYSHPYPQHPYQQPPRPVSPHDGYYPPLAQNFIDPQLYYSYGSDCPPGYIPGSSVATDVYAMRPRATSPYDHRYTRQNSRFVPHLELHAPTHHTSHGYGVVSPTESTYSELRNALSEPPISPLQQHGGHALYSAPARSPVAFPSSDVESITYAPGRPSVSRSSSELLHALDESQVRCPSRLSGPAESTGSCTAGPTSPQPGTTPQTEDPPGETNPICIQCKRAESPPMDHLPWPPETGGTRKAQSADSTSCAGSSRPAKSPQDPLSPKPATQEPPRRAPRQQTTSRTTPSPTPFQFIQDGSAFPFERTSASPLPFPIVTAQSALPTSTDGLRIAPAPPSPEDARKALQLVHRSELSKDRRRARKKPAMACLFCRERKIACGPPVPGSNDPACNQCARRNRKCEYPTECRRGQHKRGAKPAEDRDGPGADHDHDHDHDHGGEAPRSASTAAH